MIKGKSISGEEFIRKQGLFVVVPVNQMILLTQSESNVMNVIRHCISTETRAMSLTLFEVLTGMSKNSVRTALSSLERMGLIETGSVCKKGTYYKVKYTTYCGIIKKMNETYNPIERLRIADEFRGQGKALHTATIAKYTDSEFDTK